MNGLRITLAAGVAAAIASTSLSARADEERGLSAGVRVGYAVALGNAQTGQSLYNLEGGANPFWFDLGWRFNRSFYLGAFYQFAMAYPPSHSCGTATTGPVTCDGNDQRFGIDAAFHILPEKLVDPWVGLGVGYEFAAVHRAQVDSQETTSHYEGWQYVDLQLGADLRFIKRLPFGPFLDLSFGQYHWETVTDQNGKALVGGTGPGGAGHPYLASELHEWLTLGIRGQFNL